MRINCLILIAFILIFSCKKETQETSLPLVSTNLVSEITETSSQCGGNITSDGGTKITERGVCWSTTHNPTILTDSFTYDGYGSGIFLSYVKNLKPNTIYYIRAYATNKAGTSYGDEKSFTTKVSNNDSVVPGNLLFIELNENSNTLIINVQSNATDTSYSVSGADNVFSKCKSIDDIISNHQDFNSALLDENINYLSEIFIERIENLIGKCELINIKISLASVKIPFEFLKYKQALLYTEKPIIYSYNQLDSNNLQLISLDKGLIISDPTADPENACGSIAKNYENSSFNFIKDVNINYISSADNIDFILFSIHGAIDLNTCSGFMAINGAKLYPVAFSQKKLKLIYFDSCHQGKTINFIERFRDLEAEYYLGPITSNEAGNSSTKTIIIFFENLKTYNPAISLFKTKKILKSYTSENTLQQLFYAAPFRIYKLN